jgi:Fe-S cluster biogenesis protein NfuA
MNLQSLLNKVTSMASGEEKLKIKIQPTPNPDAKKFVLNIDVRRNAKATFNDITKCSHVPLAEELLNLPGVTNVHFFENVITVTQNGQADWDELQEMVEGTICSLAPDHNPDFPTAEELKRAQLSPDLQKIESILDEQIRPYLQGDGGDLEIVKLDGKVLTIRYEGACGTCPSSVAGTLNAINSVLKDQYDPELDVVTV